MVRSAHLLIWGTATAILVAAVAVLGLANTEDPTRRPARAGARGGATPE